MHINSLVWLCLFPRAWDWRVRNIFAQHEMRRQTSVIVSMALGFLECQLIHQGVVAKLPVTEYFLLEKQTNISHTNLLFSTTAIKVLAVRWAKKQKRGAGKHSQHTCVPSLHSSFLSDFIFPFLTELFIVSIVLGIFRYLGIILLIFLFYL